MRVLHTLGLTTAILLGSAIIATAETSPRPAVELWPSTAPGEAKQLDPETNISKPGEGLVGGRSVIRLANVSRPTLTVYSPPAHRNTGAAVLVCPGGGYNIHANDLEGTEVCEWLNTIGVTGVLLKYRVPRRDGREKHDAPLQDASRAIRLTRQHASEWGIDPNRIGVLGFSAGGHLATVLSNHGDASTYEAIDEADKLSSRPNFSVLIYPAYLLKDKDSSELAPELTISKETPSTFIAITADDPVGVEGALYYSLALKKTGVPLELHVYPSGGHGYGLRPTTNPVTAWPHRATEWMRAQGLLEPEQSR
jgi:acetyl esterase/lipase